MLLLDIKIGVVIPPHRVYLCFRHSTCIASGLEKRCNSCTMRKTRHLLRTVVCNGNIIEFAMEVLVPWAVLVRSYDFDET